MPETRAATLDDAAPFIAATLEPVTLPMLRAAIERSAYTFHASADGAPLFIGGCIADGRVWMLSTPLVQKHRKFCLTETRRLVAVMRERFGTLRTDIAEDYPPTLRHWLKWLGFEVGARRVELK